MIRFEGQQNRAKRSACRFSHADPCAKRRQRATISADLIEIPLVTHKEVGLLWQNAFSECECIVCAERQRKIKIALSRMCRLFVHTVMSVCASEKESYTTDCELLSLIRKTFSNTNFYIIHTLRASSGKALLKDVVLQVENVRVGPIIK